MTFGEKPQIKKQRIEKKQKCKIVLRKKGDRIEKSIEGDCSKSQLEALSGQKDIDD